VRRGLIIGKFMPLHFGHVALIRFATTQCDELIVSLTYKPNDPINGELRFDWIKEYFRHDLKIKPSISIDNFDDELLPLPERMRLWARFIKEKFGVVDVVFSSEEYGDVFAKELGINHVPFDVKRKLTPVSASNILHSPFEYWQFIPNVVRPYFVKKICLYGPESTGKSVMAESLANLYDTEFVPEVAKEIIKSNDFSADDIVQIAYAQTARVKEKLKTANKILFCDTDLITTEIYSSKYLGGVPDVVFELEKEIHYDLYFLFYIDVPWVSDGLRDLSNQREEMFRIFEGELTRRNVRFVRVKGNWLERREIIKKETDRLLEFN
jgi:HTH-type transcriptional regulator, transcriptional repressor of NAD biosynthesis genes